MPHIRISDAYVRTSAHKHARDLPCVPVPFPTMYAICTSRIFHSTFQTLEPSDKPSGEGSTSGIPPYSRFMDVAGIMAPSIDIRILQQARESARAVAEVGGREHISLFFSKNLSRCVEPLWFYVSLIILARWLVKLGFYWPCLYRSFIHVQVDQLFILLAEFRDDRFKRTGRCISKISVELSLILSTS